ncbi:CD151 antigen, partial [Asbolus verrucosus]
MMFGRRMDGCGNFMKYGLFIINIIILLGGLIVAGLGLWTVIDKSFANELLGTNLYSGAAYVLVITGLAVSIISCFGCFGAIKEVRCMLVTYFIALFLIFVTMLIGGILGYVFREKAETTLQNAMFGSIKSYGNYRPVTEAWDETQTRLMCCGVNDYRDWKDQIPDSCCKLVLGRRQRCNLLVENHNAFTLYMRGCLEVTKEYVKEHAVIIGSAGVVVACLMLPVQTEKPLKNSFDSDSLTSIFSPWQKHREPPIYSNAQTGRTVSASEFYLFYVSILLLILGLSLSAISVWSIFFKMPFKLLIDTSSELAYFALPSAILCLPCFWIVLSVHNDGKSHKFLSLVIILLTFSIVLMVIGVYIGSTHKLHLKLSEIERRPDLLNEFRNSMKGSLKLYEKYKGNKRVWDQVQANFGCCGIDNFTDWFPVNKRIPTSCCHKVLLILNFDGQY